MTSSCCPDRSADGACLSTTRTYRYALWRVFEGSHERPALGFLMLNPSVAAEHNDDPTIRRCIGFAKRDGHAGIEVVNLFPVVSTNPDGLAFPTSVESKLQNYTHVHDTAGRVKLVVAFGAELPVPKPLFDDAMELLMSVMDRVNVFCLGTTKNGYPRHPLYVRGDTPIVPYRMQRGEAID